MPTELDVVRQKPSVTVQVLAALAAVVHAVGGTG